MQTKNKRTQSNTHIHTHVVTHTQTYMHTNIRICIDTTKDHKIVLKKNKGIKQKKHKKNKKIKKRSFFVGS